jgi:hypothetical protein
MSDVPVQRHVISESVAWTVRRTRSQRRLWFLSASGEVRVLGSEDGEIPTAYAAFNREVVGVLQSLESKGLVQIDRPRSRALGLPRAARRYAAMTAEVTDAGRSMLRTP